MARAIMDTPQARLESCETPRAALGCGGFCGRALETTTAGEKKCGVLVSNVFSVFFLGFDFEKQLTELA